MKATVVTPSAKAVGSPLGEPVPRPAKLEEVQALLDATARAMGTIPEGCRDTCCAQPQRRQLESKSFAAYTETELILALRWLVDNETDPKRAPLRALAVEWLSIWEDGSDLARFERLLGDTTPAGTRAESPPSQGLGAGSGSLSCRMLAGLSPQTLDAVALRVVRRVAGHHFASAEDYRRWRVLNTVFEDSLPYWLKRMHSDPPPAVCAEWMRSVARKNPHLLLTLGMLRGQTADEPDGKCPSPILVRETLRASSRENALGVLATPEPVGERFWERKLHWVLSNPQTFLSTQSLPALEALLIDARLQGDGGKGQLVAVIAELDPSRKKRLLLDWVDRLQPPPRKFITVFAATFPEDPRLHSWLRESACDDGEVRAVLTGVARSGPHAKRWLKELADAPATRLVERGPLVGVFADVAVAMGANAEQFKCRDSLRFDPCRKLSAETRARERAALERALPTCLSALRRWHAR